MKFYRYNFGLTQVSRSFMEVDYYRISKFVRKKIIKVFPIKIDHKFTNNIIEISFIIRASLNLSTYFQKQFKYTKIKKSITAEVIAYYYNWFLIRNNIINYK